MSKFSEQLRTLIQESGESISSISRSTGTERTSIHKAIIDERILPYQVVRNLASHFQMTIDEREVFFRNYDILLQGEDNYENRRAICSLLNYLSAFSFHRSSHAIIPAEWPEIKDPLIRGEYAVRCTIRQVIAYELSQKEDAFVQMYLPPQLDLTDAFTTQWLSGKEFHAEQIFCFRAGMRNEVPNIRLLKQLLPLSIASRGKYKPYYFYSHSDAEKLTPFSYYIITPGHLVLLSENLSVAQIHSCKSVIDFYSCYFHGLVEKCETLTDYGTDVTDILNEYKRQDTPPTIRVISHHPCPNRYLDGDLIERYYGKEIDDPQVLRIIENQAEFVRRIPGDFYSVFAEEGLRDFIDGSFATSKSKEFTPPPNVKDRQKLLKSFREGIDSGEVLGLMVRPTVLTLPENFGILVDEKCGIYLYTIDDFLSGTDTFFLHITEKSIVKVFLDFIHALPGSPMVYSKKDALKIIDKYVN